MIKSLFSRIMYKKIKCPVCGCKRNIHMHGKTYMCGRSGCDTVFKNNINEFDKNFILDVLNYKRFIE